MPPHGLQEPAARERLRDVGLATAVALKTQDKERFVELLNKSLELSLDDDPDNRLSNDYAQQKARFLLEHLDDMFL